MIKLNLTANNKPQELILAYLQENASDVLADKINNGVVTEKDGKQLLNKKSLAGFMKFASDEARKLAEKGANSACVENDVVYGWAIHYFEEDGIQGTLYYPDGTEYTPPKPVAKTKPVTSAKVEPTKPKQQPSLFDMLADKNTTALQSDCSETVECAYGKLNVKEQYSDYIQEEPTEVDIKDAMQALDDNGKRQESKEINPIYKQYTEVQAQYPDCIVVMRLGDFYEIFGNDAVTVAKELDLTLTSRDVGLEIRVPMAGVPYHAKDMYLSKLRVNHKVAVIENNKDIELLSQTFNNIDVNTGELLAYDTEKERSLSDNEAFAYLNNLLDGKLDIALR